MITSTWIHHVDGVDVHLYDELRVKEQWQLLTGSNIIFHRSKAA